MSLFIKLMVVIQIKVELNEHEMLGKSLFIIIPFFNPKPWPRFGHFLFRFLKLFLKDKKIEDPMF
jgi:hypothetical protein